MSCCPKGPLTQEDDGGFVAECLSHDIFTQGNTWEELRANVLEAVSAYFFDKTKPALVCLVTTALVAV